MHFKTVHFWYCFVHKQGAKFLANKGVHNLDIYMFYVCKTELKVYKICFMCVEICIQNSLKH